MTEYDFDTQYRIGEKHALELDKHFSAVGYQVTPTSRFLQKREIDRIFTIERTGIDWTVEYKACRVAPSTNNAFIETVSVLEKDIPGWARSSWAQLLVYYVPQWNAAYLASMTEIRMRLKNWIAEYGPEKDVPNHWDNGNKYTTRGVCVPISEFQSICYRTLFVESLDEKESA